MNTMNRMFRSAGSWLVQVRRCGNAVRLLPVIVLTLVLSLTGAANAEPLGLTMQYPDLYATGLSGAYNSATKTFTVGGSGLLMGLDLDGGGNEYLISAGTYNLTANILNDGTFVSGSLAISGALRSAANPAVVITSGSALTGTLQQFGYIGSGAGGGIFEFTFSITGGYLTPTLFPGNSGEIIVSSTTGTFGANGFNSSFTLTNVRADTFVPLPMALPAGLALVVAVGYYRWWRKSSASDQ